MADEARTIRRLEKRNIFSRQSLYLHRINDVRKEARAALLAYAFLKGTPYRDCERNPKSEPNWKRVEDLVKKYCFDWCAHYELSKLDNFNVEQLREMRNKYSPESTLQRFKEWRASSPPLEDPPKS